MSAKQEAAYHGAPVESRLRLYADHSEDGDVMREAADTIEQQAAQLAAVLELHQEDLFRGYLSNGCKSCGQDDDYGYPCRTARALGVPIV